MRCEALIERAPDHEPGTFTQAREDAKSFREFAKIAADSRRRETLTRRGEVDFFAAMHAQLKSGHFWIGHVSVLVLVVSQLQGGRAIGPTASIEGAGASAELVFDHAWGLVDGGIDGEGNLENWRFLLDYLVENGWLTRAKSGPKWRIGLGPKTLEALREQRT